MVRGLMCGHSAAFWVERQLGACATGGADRPAADTRGGCTWKRVRRRRYQKHDWVSCTFGCSAVAVCLGGWESAIMCSLRVKGTDSTGIYTLGLEMQSPLLSRGGKCSPTRGIPKATFQRRLTRTLASLPRRAPTHTTRTHGEYRGGIGVRRDNLAGLTAGTKTAPATKNGTHTEPSVTPAALVAKTLYSSMSLASIRPAHTLSACPLCSSRCAA